MDGTGYWVVGDPQRTLYVANGATTGTVVNSNANNADYNGNLQLQGCTAYPANGALPTVVYFVRSSEYYVYLDQTTTPTQNWATTMSLTVPTNPQQAATAPQFGGQVRFPHPLRARWAHRARAESRWCPQRAPLLFVRCADPPISPPPLVSRLSQTSSARFSS